LEKDAHDFHGAFVWIIILLGVGFSDIIYFQMVSTMFPNAGLMQGIAFAGAITTALSVLLLYHGKKKIFRPGKQVWTAWVFTAVEIAVMMANDILYFAKMNGGSLDAFMSFWKVFCPAAPVLSVLGWLLISYFDPSRALLHLKMSKSDELEASEARMHAEVEQSEIDFKRAMHNARMDAKYAALEDMQRHLAKAIQYEVQEDLRLGAGDMGRDIASSLTNTPISQLSQPRKPRVVDADPPAVDPAIAAHKVQFVDPHKVKPEVDSEKKPFEEKKGLRAWIDEKVFKVEDDGSKGELVSPVNYDQDESSKVWEKKNDKWMGAEKARQEQGEKIKEEKPKLPINPAKWTRKHWLLAQEILPKDEYDELFDEYLGDKPTEDHVRESHEDPSKTKALPEND
jgi:hypothetical protein